MQSKITVHMVVKNEDRFVWYAINSVLSYVDKILICDTGSTDQTIRIIKTFKDKKLQFWAKNIDRVEKISDVRQEQIDKSETDWIWIVDGDEIYPEDLCQEIINIIKLDGEKLEGIVIGRYDLMGDIYHYQDESVGTYNIFGRTGHWVLRLINKKKIPGLHIEGIYPYEGYYDNEGKEIIYHDPKKFRFTKGRLLHAMYLSRSSKGPNLTDTFHRNKWKTELGHSFPPDFQYPEVFSQKRPTLVDNVTSPRVLLYEIIALIITPIKILKRKFFNFFT